MSIKQVIKETFEEEFNKEKMKEDILVKAESKRQISLNILFKIAIPICAFTFIVLAFSNSHYKTLDKVYINELQNRNDVSRMSNVIEESNTEVTDFKLLDQKVLPSDFKEERYNKIYTGNTDMQYVFTSFGNNDRYLEISFGEKDLSKKDLYTVDIKKSKINGIEMVLFQYDTSYIGTYFYQGYYFDVQAYNMTKVEFIDLLKSITK